jgi:hypothetical protein
MNAPMMGTWSVEILAVKPFSIHGDQYYELRVRRTDDAAAPSAFALKVPQHAVEGGAPRVGHRATVQFLMGQVTAVKPEI